MAKLTEKNILDYRIGGDTLNDFALKYSRDPENLPVLE